MAGYLIFAPQQQTMNLFFLQAAAAANTTINYLPIGIQVLFALGFVALTLGGTHLLGPSRKTADKLENFESGIDAVGYSMWKLFSSILMQ